MNLTKRKFLHLLSLLLFLGMAAPAFDRVSAGDGSAYDLISAVNSYRNANGLGDLSANNYLMAAAQSQADYLASTYDIGSGANGHVGAGGSNATDRAYAFGYGGGKAITVSENWVGTSTLSASELPTCEYWADSAHQNTMLNGWGTKYADIGVGVSSNDQGVKFFVMDVGVIDGENTYDGTNSNYVDPGVVNGTATVVFNPLVTSTPRADGSIVHIVQYGETLSTIAKSYGITVDQIRELNYMAEDWTMIFEGEELVVRAKTSTSSTSGTVTVTATSEGSVTGTTAPTYTPRPARTRTTMPKLVITITASPTPTPAPGGGFSSQTLGIGLVIICGLGLLGVVGSNFIKRS
jgi:LysM repeat protein